MRSTVSPSEVEGATTPVAAVATASDPNTRTRCEYGLSSKLTGFETAHSCPKIGHLVHGKKNRVRSLGFEDDARCLLTINFNIVAYNQG